MEMENVNISGKENLMQNNGSRNSNTSTKERRQDCCTVIVNIIKSFLMFVPLIVSAFLYFIYPGRYALQQIVQLILYVPTFLFYLYLGLIRKEYKVFPKTLDFFAPICSIVSASCVFTGHAEYYNHWGGVWLGIFFVILIIVTIYINRPIALEIQKETLSDEYMKREYILPVSKRVSWHLVVVFLIGVIANIIYGCNGNYLNSDSDKAKTLNTAFGYIAAVVCVLYIRFFMIPDVKQYVDKMRAEYGYVPKAIEDEWQKDGLDVNDKSLHTRYLQSKNSEGDSIRSSFI